MQPFTQYLSLIAYIPDGDMLYDHTAVVMYLEQQGLESLLGPQIHALHMYSTLFL